MEKYTRKMSIFALKEFKVIKGEQRDNGCKTIILIPN